MVDAAGEEVAALIARGLDPKLPVMRAIGMTEIAALIAENLDRDAALCAGTQATRNYAKRQYTWFAHQPPPEWPRFTSPLDQPGAIDAALAMLGAAG